MARDTPIIFSAPMVRALLDGKKTQTRRLATSPLAKVQPGDRLWVRENHWLYGRWREDGKTATGRVKRVFDKIGQTAVFDQPGYDRIAHWGGGDGFTFKPAMHLPRWASRLTLVVEEVRTQHLREISPEDAIAEGYRQEGAFWSYHIGGKGDCHSTACDPAFVRHIAWPNLWQSLHDKPGQRWEDNPAIVALTFQVERANVDALKVADHPESAS